MNNVKVLTQIDCRYLIEKDGSVYSLFGSRGLRKKPKKIKTQIDCRGYIRIAIFFDGGKKLSTRLHRLVANAFLGLDLFDKNLTVHHKDGNKTNNSIENLEIIDYKKHAKLSLEKQRKKEKHYFTKSEKEKLSKVGFTEWEDKRRNNEEGN